MREEIHPAVTHLFVLRKKSVPSMLIYQKKENPEDVKERKSALKKSFQGLHSYSL
jgi:hypothetical protein